MNLWWIPLAIWLTPPAVIGLLLLVETLKGRFHRNN
jgi:hypothetical protein